MEKSKWQKVGVIGVDAGICWIGDPCYVFHEGSQKSEIGESWADFCDILQEKEKDGIYDGVSDFGFTGVCVSTGWGDGSYPVYVKRKDGRIAEVKVKFI